MKIIDIGICVDNVDPLCQGRIRVARYNDIKAAIEKSIKYEFWDEKDPYLALPFLPVNLNFIPEKGQSCKIINYSSDKELVNKEYLAGPFTTSYDFNSQTFTQQITDTTYGVPFQQKRAIRDPLTGKFIREKSENSFAKEKDFAIYGKNNSDVIFTENGLVIRGGKLLSKEAASIANKQTLLETPLMSPKSSRMYFKKFPKKMTLKKEEKEIVRSQVKNLNYIIEYYTNNLSTPTSIDIYVYKVVNAFGETLKTNYFTDSTPLPLSALKLINTDDTSSTPTLTISGFTTFEEAAFEVNEFLRTIHDKNLKEFNTNYPDEIVHPFYFRPIDGQMVPVNSTEFDNKSEFISNIQLGGNVGPGSGLAWSMESLSVPTEKIKVVEDKLIVDQNTPEQTFSAVVSDKIYLLSTDTNTVENIIPFEQLNKYEYSQENYIQYIDPTGYTYSLVRGEKLVEVLRSIVQVMFTHKHNLNDAVKNPTDKDGIELLRLIQNLENDILNKSVRTN